MAQVFPYVTREPADEDKRGIDAHNKAVEADQLQWWATKPELFAPAYYEFPAAAACDAPSGDINFRPYRREFIVPRIVKGQSAAFVTTWLGTRIGTITAARVHTNNLGARIVSLTVRGTNGAIYHGRAGWDWGTVVRLRKSRSAKVGR